MSFTAVDNARENEWQARNCSQKNIVVKTITMAGQV